ncbi:TIR domain-containing protein [Lacihabitans sp. LS3-19]|uniref:TIR domain-containing protein n=1 Tax=Lacihabitans sp. LS3-19 TaxID=2487335 RepID=UPI0020CCAEA1|nr:TIR domain-containing protein [Lacihabitans sp. LS3-19]
MGLNESNQLLSKDILEIAKITSGRELRENLKAYLKFEQKHEDELVPINRHQIILLGNTTAGKTELKHRLLEEERTNFDSTHGVQYFLKKIGDIEVMGYDFGGQDYYHALHLSFFDTLSHYIIVWGNHKNKVWGNYNSYFGKTEIPKEIKNIEIQNLLYPIEYWLKSIQKISFLNNHMYYSSKSLFNKQYEFVGRLKYAKETSQDISEEEIAREVFKPNENEPIVDIIQNVSARTFEMFLNNKDLKSTQYVRVQDILSFDFIKPDVGEWLRNKIKERSQIQQNSVLKAVKEFGEGIYKEGLTLINHSTLEAKIKGLNIKYNKIDIDQFKNSLINYKYLLFLGKNIPELSQYYIVNIQKFSEFIYQVLSKELAVNEKNQGYFNKLEAFERIKCKDKNVKEYVLNFLIKTDIIFEVEGTDSINPKFVAPSYLPNPKEKIENLFIDSFESPDCQFEFNNFFHPNIILQVVKHYKNEGLLVKDDAKVEYLLWKNCVIIYNNSKASKQYLKLELLLPNKEYQNRTPVFSISRSSAGLIENDQFYQVFKEIKNRLSQYSPLIKVKTPYGNYIPFDDINMTISEGNSKKSQFVYSDGVLYPKYDFRHFLGDELNAPLKIFIAYSKFDDIYRLELRDHLYPGIAEGKFTVFDDREMDMGEKWHARLKKELEQCDIFILLISVKTLGTPYVMNVEIPEAMKRFNLGGLKIIPILVSPCDWTKTGLKELNIYDKAQPISTNSNSFDLSQELGVNERAAKWQEIVKYIEKITPNGTNPSNIPTSSNEPVSGAYKANDRKQ